MTRINSNLGKLLLLMVKGDTRVVLDKYWREEEYYTDEENEDFGVICYDITDGNYAVAFFVRNEEYKLVLQAYEIDINSLIEARNVLLKLSENRVKGEIVYRKASLFDIVIAKDNERHPYYDLLKDSEFYRGARGVLEEVYSYFNDTDGNFKEQFQSKNGFDARIWELYLWAWLREDGFNVNNDYDVPDFVVEQLGSRIGIEAVTVSRRDDNFGEMPPLRELDETLSMLDNDIPLMFGSSLYTKLTHTCNKQRYWELPHMKDLPFVIAIADFHEDMSMTWTFSGIVSILYGIEQRIIEEDGKKKLNTENGKVFIKDTKKGDIGIIPLFLSEEYEHISAVIFSSVGTLSKFNRIGKMCGMGAKSPSTMIVSKMLYDHAEGAILPKISVEMVNEDYSERWSEGVNIFHNPRARNPLNSGLFPNVAHHYYKDGFLYSENPQKHPFCSWTSHIKGLSMPDLGGIEVQFKARFDEATRQWNQK